MTSETLDWVAKLYLAGATAERDNISQRRTDPWLIHVFWLADVNMSRICVAAGGHWVVKLYLPKLS